MEKNHVVYYIHIKNTLMKKVVMLCYGILIRVAFHNYIVLHAISCREGGAQYVEANFLLMA